MAQLSIKPLTVNESLKSKLRENYKITIKGNNTNEDSKQYKWGLNNTNENSQ